jgi:hypothetical protein
MQSAATPTTSCDMGGGDILTFRYIWNLKIAKRLLANRECAVMHVSSPFCTAYNGVQFTWILRMCDQNILQIVDQDDMEEECDGIFQNILKRVNITLYYKDGPTSDITLDSATISVNDSSGKKLLNDTPLGGMEYTLGAGWSPWSNAGNAGDDWLAFSEFAHNNIGAQISVCVDLRIKANWFQPFNYLPSLESANSKLETICEKVLKDIYTKKLIVPDSEFFNQRIDKFAYHRHVFKFACREILERLDESLKSQISLSKIQTVFAHIYFNHVIMAETVCFEDFVEILEASITTNFPELLRECERFICREVMVDSVQEEFVKKMLLLAERFNLPVLKMVSSGALVDKLISSSNQPTENAMHKEFLQIAEKITTTEEEDADDESSVTSDNVECLVHNVVNELQSLAKHIRRVSLSASCGSLNNSPGSSSSQTSTISVPGVFAAPQPVHALSPVPNAGHIPPAGRRSSLKTSRELLPFSGNAGSLDSDNSSLHTTTSSINNSPLLGNTSSVAAASNSNSSNPRRRSIMFSLQTFRFEDENDFQEEMESVDEGVGSSADSNDGQTSPSNQNNSKTLRITSDTSHFALHVSP